MIRRDAKQCLSEGWPMRWHLAKDRMTFFRKVFLIRPLYDGDMKSQSQEEQERGAVSMSSLVV